MEVIIVEHPDEIGVLGAEFVAAQVAKKADSVIGVATGSSPLGIYNDLGRRVKAGELSLAKCKAFMLDEYVGIDANHPERYRNVIEKEFVSQTDIDPANVQGPNGLADDVQQACLDYEQAIKDAGGVDLQLLGIGTDGHIAFNEPGSSLASRTRIKTLTAQTREDNARFFDGDIGKVPTHCLTQGIGTIMDARHLLLVASGRHKADAIHQLVEGPISAMWPGTIMQMHPHASVIVDKAAASRLQLASYYAETYAKKPAWQRP